MWIKMSGIVGFRPGGGSVGVPYGFATSEEKTLFSLTIEYAMRAVLALAGGDGSPMTTKDIANMMQVPRSYLSKVLQSLARGKIVVSTRGLNGGFVLARKPDEVTMLDIMDAVSPIKRIESCPLDRESQSSDLCPLHRRLDDAMAHVQKAFAATTLAELLSEENHCPTMRKQLSNLVPIQDLE